MRRNPLYSFKDVTSVGIYDVPLNSTVHILDNGTGVPQFVEIIAKTGLGAGSPIGQFLANPNLYIDFSGAGSIPSELAKVQEGGNDGWRILGRNPDNYGDIGQGAIDFNESLILSTTVGATGYNSFAAGTRTTASGRQSAAFGDGTVADNYGAMAVGRYNQRMLTTGTSGVDNVFAVGVGLSPSNPRDGLVVTSRGNVESPESTIFSIDGAGDRVLITREYVQSLYIPLSEKAAALGVATLDVDGKIPSDQVPAIAISETYVVGSQAEQLALRVEIGDVCIRTDISQTFIQNGGSSGTMSDWTMMATPTQSVISVNGQIGAVSLGLSDLNDIDTSNLMASSIIQFDGIKWVTVDGSSLGVNYFKDLMDTPNTWPAEEGYLLKTTSVGQGGVVFENIIDGGSYSGGSGGGRSAAAYTPEPRVRPNEYTSPPRASRI